MLIFHTNYLIRELDKLLIPSNSKCICVFLCYNWERCTIKHVTV
nr:MAG TPA: hypothetical protein [Caudoviricetes sp.]DAU44318.1 MAG TPA: hypothetical protein [Caudoviricetes sp.]